MKTLQLSAGRPYPLGATFDGEGVNFAVFSQHASRVTLCLFDDDGREALLVDLAERDGHVWHGYFSGMQPGQQYGYRIHGPYAPEEGHRFNPHKLLIDPYAKKLTGHLTWHDSLHGYEVGHKDADLSFDTRDSAPYMPRCVVVDPAFTWGPKGGRIDRPWNETIIYEAHVKGMTAARDDVDHPGTFLGMASEPILDHLTDLGITAVELMPVQAFVDDRFLVDQGLRNYWGYMTLGFFAPDPRYLSYGDIAEFQQMVARFHAADIEVILDVVYNHTAEGNENGPTLAFRGFDNASYYRLSGGRHYVNDAGTGNVLNFDHPFTIRLVMDSLRYWVEVMHVDGFRFDLASTLARTGGVFDRDGPFMRAIRQDPVLNRVKLIAEPWDVGMGGYQLGAYPAPFAEWNDKYRDQVRRFWRGDKGTVQKLATRVAGSSFRFDHDGRPSTSSINYLTSHDGFTLMDTVSYNEKHNEANGEGNKDGHGENFSNNCGVEGPSEDPKVIAKRAQRRRNMVATLMLSQGTPMILGGDELGNSQGGNNNAYSQDNATGWIDWENADDDFLQFCKDVILFRKATPILRQTRFLHARPRLVDGVPDLFWRRADGKAMTAEDWGQANLKFLGAEMRMARGTPAYEPRIGAIYTIFNNGGEIRATLPEAPTGQFWARAFDTAGGVPAEDRPRTTTSIAAESVVAFTLRDIAAKS
ncbi:MAG: glycogen debranching protein GlgX [Pseudomonadota bacterium]